MEKDNERMEFNRRNFLKGMIVSGALAGSAGLIACSPPQSQEAPGTDPNVVTPNNEEFIISEDAEVITADVVVVGSGTAGTPAALAAAEAGAHVVVIEKAGSAGGISAFGGGGMFAAETALQAEAGVNVTIEDTYKHVLEFNRYTGNAPLIRAIIEKGASTVEWLQNYGVDMILCPGTDQLWHMTHENILAYHLFWGTKPSWVYADTDVDASLIGDHKYSTLLKSILALGGEIHVSTTAKKLIMEDGKAAGVACEREDGSQLVVKAGAVVLAAGGFGGTSAAFYDKSKLGPDMITVISMDNHEGVEMAVEAGAQEWGSNVIMIHNSQAVSAADLTEGISGTIIDLVTNGSYSLWVNRQGIRFANEEIQGDSALWANTINSQGGVFYIVFDQAEVDDLEANGSPTILSVPGHISVMNWVIGMNEDIDVNTPPVFVTGSKTGPAQGINDELAQLVSDGKVLKADSIEELAAAAGMDPAALKGSIDSYNSAVSAKQDAVFYKSPEFLVYPVQAGPFYLLRQRQMSLGGTMGGIRITEKGQALAKEDGSIIPGLYAAGTNAGGYYGNNGNYIDYEGSAVSFSINSGRISGENAAAEALRG